MSLVTDLSGLMLGQRYLFHYVNPKTHIDKSFRANFFGVHVYDSYSTMVIRNYDSKVWCMNPAEIWYMDPRSITKVQTLADMLGGKSKLPDDVLIYIDNFF
jgi:hypothetical protein